ncbi:MAG: tyrosine-protein phosphatase [Clostridiales bacterium]|nr:tyrosine-protein phosphatase [Clostridiales bacterium]
MQRKCGIMAERKGEEIMASLFASTRNTRALPGCGMRFLRSDAPLCLAEEEVQWLVKNNVRTLVDLRSKEEVDQNPCPLAERDGFFYCHLPVTGGGATPKSRAHLHETYAGMIDAQMDRILETILCARTNVMYFCTAGKDRTGVVTALLLRKMGCDEKTIVDDYMLSGDNLMDMLTAYAQAHPEVDLDIIVPKRENIERILRLL